MNELRRMAYLDAMGLDSYVSRGQLPGAAATRRLAIVRSSAAVPAPAVAIPAVETTPQPEEIRVPRIDSGSRKTRPSAPVKPGPAHGAPVPRFSLAAFVSGGWLWLEDLDGQPLAREQVQLIQGMSRAWARIVQPPAAGSEQQPIIAQFDWPIHNNQQLDQGEDAARAGVAAFIGRKLEQHECRGLVLLGSQTRQRVLPDALGKIPLGITEATLAMLADPTLKKQAWTDLLALAARLS